MPKGLESRGLVKLEALDCEIISRLNRFVVVAKINGREEKVHITNTGRLEEFIVRGKKCKIIKINGKKLKYRIVSVEHRDGLHAVIDTRLQARSFEVALENGLLCFLHDCKIVAREPRIRHGRADYMIQCGLDRLVVELKSAVLEGPRGEAMYPDCPSDRGVKHIRELASIAEGGGKAAIVFVAGFPGARCFKPYEGGDPRIPPLLRQAINVGVRVYSFSIGLEPSTNTIFLENPCLPLCGDWLQGDDEW